jgi:hypothetical protein
MTKAYFASLAMLVGCATEMPVDDDGFRRGSKADDASGWSHAVLGSAEGIGISIDYVSHFYESHDYKPTHVDSADPVYANVWADQFTGDEAVRVVFMNYERCEKSYVPYTYSLDLTWYGDHFSGDLSHDAAIERSYLKFPAGTHRIDTRWSGYGGNHPFCQEVAVVVDDKWLVDPLSSGNNFKIDMFAQR